MISEDILLKIVSVGITAVSTYNGQPWRFALRENGLDISAIEEDNLFKKFEGITYIEIGAALENLAEGAAHYGLETQVEYLSPELGVNTPNVRLEFKPGTASPKDIRHVLERCTNRNAYSNEPVPVKVQRELAALNDDPNIQLFFWSGHEKHRLADILSTLERIRFSNYSLVIEALKVFRLTAHEINNRRDLLNTETLFSYRHSETVMKVLRFSPFSRFLFLILKSLGHHRRLANQHIKLLRENGTMIMFVVKERDYKSYIRLGRIVQRILNELTRRGLASMSALGGLSLIDISKKHPEIFSKKQIQDIAKTNEQLEKLFDTSTQKIAFIVRSGIAPPPKERASRRELHSFILEKKS